MNRINASIKSITVLAMVMAITAGSAVASNGYQSVNSITGGDGVPASTQPQQTDYSSLAAMLGEPASASPIAAPAYRSLNAIVGARTVGSEQAVSIVRERSGFDWADALIGAAITLGLMLVFLFAVQAVRRRGGVAESRA